MAGALNRVGSWPFASAWRSPVALALALTAVLTPLPAAAFSGVVTRVSDGDTIWVRPDASRRKPVKVRLLGLDAPERCQRWGAEAGAALSERVLHRQVQVPTRAADAYGRVLGGLTLAGSGEDIGAWMVRQGHAWNSRYRGRDGPYAAEEAAARSARRGLFADPQAEMPRQFRQRHGPCDTPLH